MKTGSPYWWQKEDISLYLLRRSALDLIVGMLFASSVYNNIIHEFLYTKAGSTLAIGENPRGDKDMKSNKTYKDMTREERKEAAQAKAQAALDRIGDGVRSKVPSRT